MAVFCNNYLAVECNSENTAVFSKHSIYFILYYILYYIVYTVYNILYKEHDQNRRQKIYN